MKKAKQLQLFKQELRHGGGLRNGKRKTIRPLDTKRPIHLVMKSERANGKCSLLHPTNKKNVDMLLQKFSHKFNVRILRAANVGNHLHLVVKTKTRANFQNFLRTITGRIAIAITGAQKGIKQAKFWSELAFTKVITWGKELNNVMNYLNFNLAEATGLIKQKTTHEYLW